MLTSISQQVGAPGTAGRRRVLKSALHLPAGDRADYAGAGRAVQSGLKVRGFIHAVDVEVGVHGGLCRAEHRRVRRDRAGWAAVAGDAANLMAAAIATTATEYRSS
jgi:hypothetical protein